MANPVGGLDEIAAVVAADAMKKDGLSPGIGDEIGGFGHLLQRRTRASHGDDDPIDAGPADHLILCDILRVITIDRRERDDRSNFLGPDQAEQGAGPLPCASHDPSGLDD